MEPYILLLDDNDDLAYNLKLLLEMEGYAVNTSSDAYQALDLARHAAPGLIVADIRMPETNGYDFFQEIKSDQLLSTVPFIFLSALTSAEDVARGLGLGADDYITKPFNIEDLLTVVRRYM
jgi:DNA-binding response OmpR family regulator